MTEALVKDLPEVDVITTIGELNAAAAGLQRAGNAIYRAVKEFEGPEGIGTRYRIAVESKKVEIYDDALKAERRPPAEDIRDAKAELAVRAEQPDLYREWLERSTDIKATQIWISAAKASINARQSVLKGERG